jgi:hypothetical protein
VLIGSRIVLRDISTKSIVTPLDGRSGPPPPRSYQGRCGELADELTWGREVVRRATGSGERNPVEAVGIKMLGERW